MDINKKHKQDFEELEIPEEQTADKQGGNTTDDITTDAENNVTDSEEKTDASESKDLEKEVSELKSKLEQAAKEKLLVMADFDNYRKRTLKEKADLIKSGGEECLKSLLPIIDDFERSIAAINDSSDITALKEGVTHIYNKFNKYLSQHGIKPIDTENADFNTEFHEAVTMYPVEDPEKKGKVIDCVQKGYTMNDKVIRFAKVVVGE